MTAFDDVHIDFDKLGPLDQATDDAEGSVFQYDVIARSVIQGRILDTQHPWNDLFFQAMVVRLRGLHEGAVREIRAENPHGAFTLIRAWAEGAALVRYVIDHPEYIRKLATPKRDLNPNDGRLRTGALIAYASKTMPGIKDVYSELSEVAHFGLIAFWTSFYIGEGDTGPALGWQSTPRFRDERSALIACGWVQELSIMSRYLLQEFARLHLPSDEEE